MTMFIRFVCACILSRGQKRYATSFSTSFSTSSPSHLSTRTSVRARQFSGKMARSRSPSGDVTLADTEIEHVRVVSEESVSERIDPRISPTQRANEEELDSPYLRQLSGYIHPREHTEATDVERGTVSDRGEKESSPLYVG
jgi:hypothetical protein